MSVGTPRPMFPAYLPSTMKSCPRWATKAFCLTLTTRLSTTATPEVDALFRHIHSLGLKTLLLSDNSAARIERFNRNIRTLFIAEAGKPDPAAYRRACAMLGLPPFKIKYEKCEIILCTVDERLKNTGITVMDGPFFSLMPFGQTGLHSLTSVTFTPHETSYDAVATFPCQQQSEGKCRPGPQIPERRVRLCLSGQPVQHEADFESQRNR